MSWLPEGPICRRVLGSGDRQERGEPHLQGTGRDTAGFSRVFPGKEHPYLWLDALYLKVRQSQRVVSQALVIATGVSDTGGWEVLGFATGASKQDAFCGGA